MSKGRLEAFSDGVIAILITILVLELKIPHGGDWPEGCDGRREKGKRRQVGARIGPWRGPPDGR